MLNVAGKDRSESGGSSEVFRVGVDFHVYSNSLFSIIGIWASVDLERKRSFYGISLNIWVDISIE